jgi:hypothetical protein
MSPRCSRVTPVNAGEPRIIFVPGQNPKPEPARHRQLLWRCLLEGVRRADPRVYHGLRARPELFCLADWNGIFYAGRPHDEQSEEAIDALLRSPVSPVGTEQKKNANRYLMLMFALGDVFPNLVRRIPDPNIKNTLLEALRYFENHQGMADKVRSYLRQVALAALQSRGQLMIIGHSLGSVLVFDMLWESSHVYGDSWKADLFLSLGSPLGTRFVRRRRLGAGQTGAVRYPAGIRRWVNIAAEEDHIALNRRMDHDYRAMLGMGGLQSITDYCSGVINTYRDEDGWNPHRSYGYLANEVTGKVIADWLREQE